ncbi:hypothetical protein LV779_25865 [Streptomyces thinghirensis]|nr:hypothetical protein [Streptomyces thinghirensis]
MADGAAGQGNHVNLVHGGGMASDRPVIVYRLTGDVPAARVDGTILGLAYSVQDVAMIIGGRAQDFDEMDVARTALDQWRGGGPEVWTRPDDRRCPSQRSVDRRLLHPPVVARDQPDAIVVLLGSASAGCCAP